MDRMVETLGFGPAPTSRPEDGAVRLHVWVEMGSRWVEMRV